MLRESLNEHETPRIESETKQQKIIKMKELKTKRKQARQKRKNWQQQKANKKKSINKKMQRVLQINNESNKFLMSSKPHHNLVCCAALSLHSPVTRFVLIRLFSAHFVFCSFSSLLFCLQQVWLSSARFDSAEWGKVRVKKFCLLGFQKVVVRAIHLKLNLRFVLCLKELKLSLLWIKSLCSFFYASCCIMLFVSCQLPSFLCFVVFLILIFVFLLLFLFCVWFLVDVNCLILI